MFQFLIGRVKSGHNSEQEVRPCCVSIPYRQSQKSLIVIAAISIYLCFNSLQVESKDDHGLLSFLPQSLFQFLIGRVKSFIGHQVDFCTYPSFNSLQVESKVVLSTISHRLQHVSIPYRQSQKRSRGEVTLPIQGMFQFLIGRVKSPTSKNSFQLFIAVSIPYRQSQKYTSNEGDTAKYDVSIPYRQSQKRVGLRLRGSLPRQFQFLIGRVKRLFKVALGDEYKMCFNSLQVESKALFTLSSLFFRLSFNSLQVESKADTVRQGSGIHTCFNSLQVESKDLQILLPSLPVLGVSIPYRQSQKRIGKGGFMKIKSLFQFLIGRVKRRLPIGQANGGFISFNSLQVESKVCHCTTPIKPLHQFQFLIGRVKRWALAAYPIGQAWVSIPYRQSQKSNEF